MPLRSSNISPELLTILPMMSNGYLKPLNLLSAEKDPKLQDSSKSHNFPKDNSKLFQLLITKKELNQVLFQQVHLLIFASPLEILEEISIFSILRSKKFFGKPKRTEK